MKWFSTVCLAFVIFGFLSAQDNSRDIPKFGGDGNEQHDGQPQWCQARDENGFKKNCGKCDMECPKPGEAQIERSACATYCRKGACNCAMCKVTKNKKPGNDVLAGAVIGSHCNMANMDAKECKRKPVAPQPVMCATPLAASDASPK